jgi:hypothetical protein
MAASLVDGTVVAMAEMTVSLWADRFVCFEGFLLGCIIGCLVGWIVCWLDGFLEGCMDGTLLGIMDG